MGWARIGLLAGVLASGLSIGCQNKLYDQNKQLYDENKALRAQNEQQQSQLRQQQQSAILTPAAPPVQAQPQPAAPANPVPDNQAAQAPAAPKSVEQIGGLETTVSRRTGNTIVHLPSDVFFDPGAATLKSSAKASLDKVVLALKKQFASKNVVVEGHTDSTPIKVSKWASNQELSEARAKAVKDYLVKRGIDSDRIRTKGLGDTKPRGAEMSRNRRVEIVVLTGRAAAVSNGGE